MTCCFGVTVLTEGVEQAVGGYSGGEGWAAILGELERGVERGLDVGVRV